MEQEPEFENEEISEDQLIELLKSRGVEDTEVRELLLKWTAEQEKKAEESEDHHLAYIELSLRQARLYLAAGYIEEAFESYEAARTFAYDEFRDELYEVIMKEMDEVEDSLENSK